jgi:predicted pyridoxine 5'-phosphate oxidase superfamily flavin-nucleotide-binding protein
MASRFSELMFTPAVKRLQQDDGSRAAHARSETAKFPTRDRLTSRETDFIASRDSFYMASVSETGWPYVQHRGGPPGFIKVLDDRSIGFADYPGNRQFVSFGNIGGDDRVSLILMDYPNRRRLKILGHARLVDPTSLPDLIGPREVSVARGVIVALEAFDWNCPQYITPRFTAAELEPLYDRLRALT